MAKHCENCKQPIPEGMTSCPTCTEAAAFDDKTIKQPPDASDIAWTDLVNDAASIGEPSHTLIEALDKDALLGGKAEEPSAEPPELPTAQARREPADEELTAQVVDEAAEEELTAQLVDEMQQEELTAEVVDEPAEEELIAQVVDE